MKKVMNKNKAIVIGLMAMISTSFGNPVSAMDTKNDPPGAGVKYLGFVNNNPVFELSLNNAKSDYYFITIRDEAGTVLYAEKLSGKTISRRYRIDTEEEVTAGGLRFEVRSVNTKKTDVYITGITEHVTREVAVTKIQ